MFAAEESKRAGLPALIDRETVMSLEVSVLHAITLAFAASRRARTYRLPEIMPPLLDHRRSWTMARALPR